MKFNYSARDQSGIASRGVIEAASAANAAGLLREKKLFPITISAKRDLMNFGSLAQKYGHVKSSEVANLIRQLSTMITAGLPIVDALNLLKMQSGPALAAIMGTVMEDVQGGSSLSDALAKHPKVFSRVFVAALKAGESAGVLETVLNKQADGMEKTQELNGKIKGAMIYPIIIVIGMIGVIILMMVVVVPKLSQVYSQFDSELPFATRMLIGLSNFTVKFIGLLIPAGVGLVVWFRSYIRTDGGARVLEKILKRTPLIKTVINQTMLTEFTRTLALLIGAGVPVVDALNIVSEVVSSKSVGMELKAIAKKVEKGFPMSICFTDSETFPPIVGQMVAVGEETGKLDEVLSKLSHYFEVQVEQTVKGLTTAIEPIIMVILGVGVGFLMYTIIMPIYDITNKI